MNEQDFARLEAKLDAIMMYQRSRIDLDALWSAADIAEYLRVTPRQVRERIVKDDTFPSAMKRKCGTTTSHARWRARDVIDWVENYWIEE